MGSCMNKIGKFFFIMVSILLGFRLLKGASFSEEIIRKSEEETMRHARPITPDETLYLTAKMTELQEQNKRENGLKIKLLQSSAQPVQIKAVFLDRWASEKASSATILKKDQLEILTKRSDNQASFSRIIDLGGQPSEDEIGLATFKDTLAILWLTDNLNSMGVSTNPLQLLHLKLVDLQSGAEPFSGVVHSQKYGLRRVALCHHPLSDSLAIAWEDISKRNSDMLFFAVEPVSKFLRTKKVELQAFALFREDRWEKRFPQFLQSGEDVFLINQTGDNFGMFAYSGRPCLGISILDSTGKPSQYGVIATKESVRGNIVIKDQTIFFEEYDSSGGKKIGVKAIDFKEVFKISP